MTRVGPEIAGNAIKTNDARWAILLGFVWLPLVVVAVQWSLTTKISLIDDIWCAVSAGIYGHGSASKFLWHAFLDSEPTRFRWIWEFEQNLRWRVLGDALGAHHAVVFSYRAITAIFCMLIVRELRISNSWLILLAPIAYAFFFPIVPEARLGLQEPLLSLFLTGALLALIRLIIRWNGDITQVPILERWLFVGFMIGISGAKETGLVMYAGLLFTFLALQLEGRRFDRWMNIILLTNLGVYIWRVLEVATHDSYSSVQGDVASFNLGWLVWRTKETLGLVVAAPSRLYWLTALLVIVFGAAGFGLTGIATRWRRDAQVRALLVILILATLQVLVSAKLKFVMRYSEPVIWLVAPFFAFGLHYLTCRMHHLRPSVIFLACLVVTAGNATPFLWQFASQQTNRAMESAMISDIVRLSEASPVLPLYIFGASPNHDWGEVRKTEAGTLLQRYFADYREKIVDLVPIVLTPVEMRPTDSDQPFLLVSQTRLDVVLSELQLTATKADVSISHCLGENTLAAPSFAQIQTIAQRMRLSTASERAWRDGGSPAAVSDTESCWNIWIFSPRFKEAE